MSPLTTNGLALQATAKKSTRYLDGAGHTVMRTVCQKSAKEGKRNDHVSCAGGGSHSAVLTRNAQCTSGAKFAAARVLRPTLAAEGLRDEAALLKFESGNIFVYVPVTWCTEVSAVTLSYMPLVSVSEWFQPAQHYPNHMGDAAQTYMRVS